MAAKSQLDGIYDDGTLEELRRRVTRITVCTTTAPTTYLAATSTTGSYLAGATGISSTEWTLADGDTSGRKITSPAKSSVTIDAGGTCGHIAFVGSTDSSLLLVTTADSQVLTSGGTVNIPAIDIEIRDVA